VQIASGQVTRVPVFDS